MKRTGFKRLRATASAFRAPAPATCPAPPATIGAIVETSAAPRQVGPALDKSARLRSEAWLALVRAEDHCEVAFCSASADDPHHVKVRGRRDDTFDITAIPMCRRHHDAAHDGKIPIQDLHRMLGEFLCRRLPQLDRGQARRVLEQMLRGLE